MADINVLLTVDTATINSGNVSTAVVITDDQSGDGDGTPGDSGTFNINATAGQTVGFSIISADGTTGTSLNYFTFESGTSDLFSELPSATNDWTGTVNSNVPTEESEAFSITFKVAGNSESPFTLDPKLHVQGGG